MIPQSIQLQASEIATLGLEASPLHAILLAGSVVWKGIRYGRDWLLNHHVRDINFDPHHDYMDSFTAWLKQVTAASHDSTFSPHPDPGLVVCFLLTSPQVPRQQWHLPVAVG